MLTAEDVKKHKYVVEMIDKKNKKEKAYHFEAFKVASFTIKGPLIFCVPLVQSNSKFTCYGRLASILTIAMCL